MEQGNGAESRPVPPYGKLFLHFLQHVVEEMGGADAEVAGGAPGLAEDAADDGEVADGGLHLGDSAGDLDSDHAARALVVLPQGVAHHVDGLRGGVHRHLARGRLHEIRARVGGDERGVENVLYGLQLAALDDDFQHDPGAGLPDSGQLAVDLLIVAFHDITHGKHDIHLVRPDNDGLAAFRQLDVEKRMGGRETGSHDGGLYRRARQPLFHNRGETREHTHGSHVRQRELPQFLDQFGDKSGDGTFRVRDFQRGIVHTLDTRLGIVVTVSGRGLFLDDPVQLELDAVLQIRPTISRQCF